MPAWSLQLFIFPGKSNLLYLLQGFKYSFSASLLRGCCSHTHCTVLCVVSSGCYIPEFNWFSNIKQFSEKVGNKKIIKLISFTGIACHQSFILCPLNRCAKVSWGKMQWFKGTMCGILTSRLLPPSGVTPIRAVYIHQDSKLHPYHAGTEPQDPEGQCF